MQHPIYHVPHGYYLHRKPHAPVRYPHQPHRELREPRHVVATENFHTHFLPQFQDEGRPHDPFVNQFGVVVGDGKYNSPQSPLNQWSTEVDPAVMAGDQWVHPYNDIGFNTEENRQYFEQGISPQGYPFMHPTLDVSYRRD